jgi:putative tryptophan/tyrosine transport system substrate-binding protein
VRRRDFIALLVGVVVARPRAVRAQQSARIPRIGYLGLGPASAVASLGVLEALRVGLSEVGYVEGSNVIVEFRWADSPDELPRFAAELVTMNVDVIFANSSTYVEAARHATSRIPIVFAAHADPVGLGHVASLSRPGGNITGVSMLMTELSVKQLELLNEAIPHARRIGVLWNPTTPSHPVALEAVKAAGGKLGVQLVIVAVQTIDDFASAFSQMKRERVDGFVVISSPLTSTRREQLAQFALEHRLPGAFPFKAQAQAGGLMSYGADIKDLFRRAGNYIGKILRGANPADLPVEQASKYELVINLKTAKALGFTVPPSLLVRADEVIE